MAVRLFVLIVCALVFAGPDGRADAMEQDADPQAETWESMRETCPRIVETMTKPSLPEELLLQEELSPDAEEFVKSFLATQAASQALALDCPTDPVDLPISILQSTLDGRIGLGNAMILGPAYEYGLRVEVDVDAARSLYRRLVLASYVETDEEWDEIRLTVASFNPKVRRMSEDELVAAWENGELKSVILESEISAAQTLLNGPIADIVAASDHYYHGSGGFPEDRSAAKEILEIAAGKGAPEAHYALARGYLDSRFPTFGEMLKAFLGVRGNRNQRVVGGERKDELDAARRELVKASTAGFLPAIELYADLCEEFGNEFELPIAYALHELAKEKGGKNAESALLRIKNDWEPIMMDRKLQRARDQISGGKTPLCSFR